MLQWFHEGSAECVCRHFVCGLLFEGISLAEPPEARMGYLSGMRQRGHPCTYTPTHMLLVCACRGNLTVREFKIWNFGGIWHKPIPLARGIWHSRERLSEILEQTLQNNFKTTSKQGCFEVVLNLLWQKIGDCVSIICIVLKIVFVLKLFWSSFEVVLTFIKKTVRRYLIEVFLKFFLMFKRLKELLGDILLIICCVLKFLCWGRSRGTDWGEAGEKIQKSREEAGEKPQEFDTFAKA